jgi:hypothetical protein
LQHIYVRYNCGISIDTSFIFQGQGLGVSVDAPEITLVPRPGHMYRWICLPHRAFFFQKSLARHSPVVCQQILNEIGITFQACKASVLEVKQSVQGPATKAHIEGYMDGYVRSEPNKLNYRMQKVRLSVEQLYRNSRDSNEQFN